MNPLLQELIDNVEACPGLYTLLLTTDLPTGSTKTAVVNIETDDDGNYFINDGDELGIYFHDMIDVSIHGRNGSATTFTVASGPDYEEYTLHILANVRNFFHNW